jgi:hypothetical protein
MSDNPHEELPSRVQEALPLKNDTREPVSIAELGLVHERIRALACALARLAARQDADEEEKAERAQKRRAAAIDAA